MTEQETFYYVESAPQVVSAFRHLRHEGAWRFRMIVRGNGSPHNDSQIERVLEELGLRGRGDVVFMPMGIRLLLRVAIASMSRRWRQYCFGDVRSTVIRLCLLVARAREFVLLDDGVGSIDYYLRRRDRKRASGRGFVTTLLGDLAGLRLGRITLFTILPVPAIDGIKIVPDTDLLTAASNGESGPWIEPDTSIFIGSKVVERKICTVEFFDEVIGKFVARFAGSRLQYIAHREEDTDKLAKFPQVEVVRLERPLELEYGFRRPIPGVVCSFFSSGLMHFLPYRGRVTILVYGLPITDLNRPFHESIKAGRHLFNDVLGLSN